MLILRFIFFCLFYSITVSCQHAGNKRKPVEFDFTVFFWNLENFFDTYDDPLTNDDEFTPFGERHWNLVKYQKKINQVWKVILSAGDIPPAVVALCEVENLKVLEDIFHHSAFGEFGYRIVHQDSPDRRGIDVALAYDPKKVDILSFSYIRVDLSLAGGDDTRDILRVKLKVGQDSCELFVNHWPSKYGGTGITEGLRKCVAQVLRREIDSVYALDTSAYIICTGDFNDIPQSNSISGVLLEKKNGLGISKEGSNAMGLTLKRAEVLSGFMEGTIKFQGRWEMVDHFFISENFYSDSGRFFVNDNSARIFASEFLLKKDEKYGGMKPFRTWQGFSYLGGVSDHLPIMLGIMNVEKIHEFSPRID